MSDPNRLRGHLPPVGKNGKRRAYVASALVCLVLSFLGGCQAGILPDSRRGTATIAAYETQVAQLQATVGQQGATLAALTPPPASPTPAPWAEVWRIEVAGPVERRPEVGTRAGATPLAAKGTYLVVPVTVENLTRRPIAFSPSTWLQVVDAKGDKFDVDTRASGVAYLIDLGLEPSFGPRSPGVPYPDVVVFEVPTDATDFTLRSTDGSIEIPLGSPASATPGA